MGSRFEVVLQGENEVRLRAAGEEALAEVQRLDAQLSTYIPTSELSNINARAASEPVQVEPRLFALLQRARHLHDATQGAFDPTVGPLMEAWGFVREGGRIPTPEALNDARGKVGMSLVHLDPEKRTIAFERHGMRLDLGAIGKGYALDEAGLLLREAGVERALIHGGTSTVLAVGRPEDGGNWNVAVPYPNSHGGSADPDRVLAVVALEDDSLSVSAVWGKAFEADGRVYGHVLDPRIGEPVTGALLSAMVHESATDGDALATALLVLGEAGVPLIHDTWPSARILLALPDAQDAGSIRTVTEGIDLNEM